MKQGCPPGLGWTRPSRVCHESSPDEIQVQVRAATWSHLKPGAREPPGAAHTARQRQAEDRTRFLGASSSTQDGDAHTCLGQGNWRGRSRITKTPTKAPVREPALANHQAQGMMVPKGTALSFPLPSSSSSSSHRSVFSTRGHSSTGEHTGWGAGDSWVGQEGAAFCIRLVAYG